MNNQQSVRNIKRAIERLDKEFRNEKEELFIMGADYIEQYPTELNSINAFFDINFQIDAENFWKGILT